MGGHCAKARGQCGSIQLDGIIGRGDVGEGVVAILIGSGAACQQPSLQQLEQRAAVGRIRRINDAIVIYIEKHLPQYGAEAIE